MSIELRKAERKNTPLKIAISGPSGSGKSYSALLMARGIASAWDKVAVIDTENGSADLYSNLGDYNVITLEAPFSPDKYIQAIKVCEQAGIEVIILDSITHVWSGKGGILEYQNALGGKYQDWAKATPLYQKWLAAILESPCDIISTIRKKTHYDISNENGKIKVEKKGMEDQIRDGFEYEVTVALTIGQNHLTDLSLVKDRTKLFPIDRQDFMISEETGKELKSWREGGAINYDLLKKEIITQLKRILNELPVSKEGYEDAVKDLTKLKLEPKNFEKILKKLKSIEEQKPKEPKEFNEEEIPTVEDDEKEVARKSKVSDLKEKMKSKK